MREVGGSSPSSPIDSTSPRQVAEGRRASQRVEPPGLVRKGGSTPWSFQATASFFQLRDEGQLCW